MSNLDTIPTLHRSFLEKAIPVIQNDERFCGLAAGGSMVLGTMDEFSDLDLVLVVNDCDYESVMPQRKELASQLGELLNAFTGEHVGEPRLVICLYGPEILHVDLKFVSYKDINEKVEIPVILWEKDECLTQGFDGTEAEFPALDPVWLAERFWCWVHYSALKIGRRELFEGVSSIDFIRSEVLGPLLLMKHGARPQGQRRIELYATEEEQEILRKTIAIYNFESCISALRSTVYLYKKIRSVDGDQKLEDLVMDYIDRITK